MAALFVMKLNLLPQAAPAVLRRAAPRPGLLPALAGSIEDLLAILNPKHQAHPHALLASDPARRDLDLTVAILLVVALGHHVHAQDLLEPVLLPKPLEPDHLEPAPEEEDTDTEDSIGDDDFMKVRKPDSGDLVEPDSLSTWLGVSWLIMYLMFILFLLYKRKPGPVQ